jgi:hypothetical protein
VLVAALELSLQRPLLPDVVLVFLVCVPSWVTTQHNTTRGEVS